MITTVLKGGLGNQMFQIVMVLAYSIRHKVPFYFVYSDSLKVGKERPTYWDTLMSSLKPFTKNGYVSNNPIYNKEKGFNYETPFYIDIPNKNSLDIVFDGYYQSHKYFQDEFPLVKKYFKLDIQVSGIRERFNHIYSFENTIAIHFRMDDYKLNPGFHPIMPYNYYKNAISYILDKTGNKNYNILVFGQEVDMEDIDRIINTLSNEPLFNSCTFKYANSAIPDYQQMLLMGICKHNVIANSSFSWWGAYIGNSYDCDKVVCYPSKWFGPLANNNVDDLFPTNWNKISIE
jgi:hypothetical protein